jgi:hypothetical protein
MMAGLLLPPRALLNGEMVGRLLSDEPTDASSDEAKALLAALPAGLSIPLSTADCQRLDAYLDQILPTFAPLPLPIPAMPR